MAPSPSLKLFVQAEYAEWRRRHHERDMADMLENAVKSRDASLVELALSKGAVSESDNVWVSSKTTGLAKLVVVNFSHTCLFGTCCSSYSYRRVPCFASHKLCLFSMFCTKCVASS